MSSQKKNIKDLVNEPKMQGEERTYFVPGNRTSPADSHFPNPTTILGEKVRK
jgi:hypothetical protein